MRLFIFISLSLFLSGFFMLGCHHHKTKSCPEGQVLAENTSQCVENFCLNNPCHNDQKCSVALNGAVCTCLSPEQKKDNNGNCYYDEAIDVTCSSYGHLEIINNEYQCKCDTGYENLPDNKLICATKSFSSQCNNGICDDGKILTYFENHKEHGVNFIVTGDGYTSSDLGYNGKFIKDARRFANGLISREPYKTYSKYINFYILTAESTESGVSLNCQEEDKNTAFKTCFWDAEGGNRVLQMQNERALDNYLTLLHKTVHLKIVILNEDRYYGGTQVGKNIGLFPRKINTHSDEMPVMIMYHEVGHAFAGLSDEYDYGGDENISQSELERRIKNSPNTDTTNDLSKIKWKHLIPYYNIGAFEGGYYLKHRVWRAQKTCVMRGFDTDQFCPVCLETIVKKILSITGKTYRLDDFLYHFPNQLQPSPQFKSIPENSLKNLNINFRKQEKLYHKLKKLNKIK